MLEFNVAQLLKSPVGTTRRYELAEPDGGQLASMIIAPLIGSATFMRSGRGILVKATVSTTLELPCSRCLEPSQLPITVQIEEEFLQTVDLASGMTLSVEEDDQALLIDDHHTLNLGEMIRQYILTEVPIQPLCRPECAGLCPICGHNRNLGPCACRPEPTDPRLATLSRWFAQHKTEPEQP